MVGKTLPVPTSYLNSDSRLPFQGVLGKGSDVQKLLNEEGLRVEL
jgi:hypothetical protein